MRLLALVALLLPAGLFACEVVNLTGQAQAAARQAVFSSNEAGIRIAYNGIKDANTRFGLGGVNGAMEAYEKELCQKLPKGTKVIKTDFKGYFVKCESGCGDTYSKLKEVAPPFLPDNKSKLKMSLAQADSFAEGFIKARVVNEYGIDPGNLREFINKEFKESLAGIKDVRQAKDFDQRLNMSIELYRKGKTDGLDPSMLRMVKALDVLGEVPYASSNNIDDELDEALRSKSRFAAAQTGDDLFVVIKNGDKVEKVLGADARGLGVLNISTRLKEIEGLYIGGGSLDSIDELVEASKRSLSRADDIMDRSLGKYQELLYEAIMDFPDRPVEESIALAHEEYLSLADKDPKLMSLRAGALSNCGSDRTTIMNQITALHNRLKEFEARGVNGYFGSSCIGAEYWLIKNGFKTVK